MGSNLDVIVVGAGLSGLSCALHLHRRGLSVLLLEQSDQVGGRVRTDSVDGFLLDRGFQVFLTSYPEARRVLDYSALKLRPFDPGARVWLGGRFQRVIDPWRRWRMALEDFRFSMASLGDMWAIFRLRRRLLRMPLEQIWQLPEQTCREYLLQAGVSEFFIRHFFKPLLGGIFLDPQLRTSARAFAFIFRMMAEGEVALPEGGMQAIPLQLASHLPQHAIRLNSRVDSLLEGGVRLESGEELRGEAVVLAADPVHAAELIPELQTPPTLGVNCLYFAAPEPPYPEPLLALNGDGDGAINNLSVLSNVAPSYAPPGQALVSVSVLGVLKNLSDEQLERFVRAQLLDWFGEASRQWRLLRVDRVEHALPDQSSPDFEKRRPRVRLRRGLYLCGDYQESGSIQGALLSGRRAAETLLADLG